MDEIVFHNGIEYRHVPAENPGFCGSCDYPGVNGGACPKGSAPCRHDTILRATNGKEGQCARYVRVRISQLRRMAHTAWLRAAHHPLCLVNGRRDRYNRFAAACLREIDRLRGGA